MAEFRLAGLSEARVGTSTLLGVAVKHPEAVHELQFGRLQEWLEGGARSPNEQVIKAPLQRVLVDGYDARS